jgi:hypothetical protein
LQFWLVQRLENKTGVSPTLGTHPPISEFLNGYRRANGVSER